MQTNLLISFHYQSHVLQHQGTTCKEQADVPFPPLTQIWWQTTVL